MQTKVSIAHQKQLTLQLTIYGVRGFRGRLSPFTFYIP